MDEAERELVWQQLPLRQRGLKIAAVFACLPQLHPRDDGEWMSVPCLPWLFRMDGDCLWWRRGEEAARQRDCAGWGRRKWPRSCASRRKRTATEERAYGSGQLFDRILGCALSGWRHPWEGARMSAVELDFSSACRRGES